MVAIFALLKLNGDRPSWSWLLVLSPCLVSQSLTFLATFPAHLAALSARTKLSALPMLGVHNLEEFRNQFGNGHHPGMDLAMMLDFAMTAVTSDLLLGALFLDGRLTGSSLTLVMSPCWLLGVVTLVVISPPSTTTD